MVGHALKLNNDDNKGVVLFEGGRRIGTTINDFEDHYFSLNYSPLNFGNTRNFFISYRYLQLD
jgi:hypothetical protein